jgi:hypothetical protein
MSMGNGETDDFWTIALQGESLLDGESRDALAGGQALDDDDDDYEHATDSAKPTTYRIPLMIHHHDNDDDKEDVFRTSTTLRLCPLPSPEGVWSPVGADAWYSSALLASLFLLSDDDWSSLPQQS